MKPFMTKCCDSMLLWILTASSVGLLLTYWLR
jgi:hypothetical protein